MGASLRVLAAPEWHSRRCAWRIKITMKCGIPLSPGNLHGRMGTSGVLIRSVDNRVLALMRMSPSSLDRYGRKIAILDERCTELPFSNASFSVGYAMAWSRRNQ